MKLTHVASTIWFMVCVGYMLVLTLHEVGFKWWLIFSLSGHSAVAVGVLISVYLFALVRDMGGSQQIQVEHPFTSTHSYMGFYVAAPLLGGLAGIFGMIGASDLSRYADGVARGTLGTTFFVWVVLDPVAGLIEILLPVSRRHRAERVARAELERKARQQKREKLLADAVAREEQERERWRQVLQPQAQRLAALLADNALSEHAEQEAVDIGARMASRGTQLHAPTARDGHGDQRTRSRSRKGDRLYRLLVGRHWRLAAPLPRLDRRQSPDRAQNQGPGAYLPFANNKGRRSHPCDLLPSLNRTYCHGNPQTIQLIGTTRAPS